MQLSAGGDRAAAKSEEKRREREGQRQEGGLAQEERGGSRTYAGTVVVQIRNRIGRVAAAADVEGE
eukprot:751580-Hanusia_phi.AAC.3